MRRFTKFASLVAMVCAAVGFNTAASFAGGSIKDDPVPYGFKWTGFYIGGQAGLATGDTSGRTEIPGFGLTIANDYDMSGALFGGYLGYNHQMGNTVLGIEGTYSGADINGSTGCVLVLNCKRNVDAIATLTGRVGYALDRSMVYGLAGVAWADVETEAVDNIVGLLRLNGGETHTGWVAGIGIEHAISPKIIARVEYNHVNLGSETHDLGVAINGTPIPGLSIPTKVDLQIDTLKVGVAIKFH